MSKIFQPELSKIVKNTTFNKIISIESAGKPKAKSPTSSAGGLFQFLSGTIYGVIQIYFPMLLKGRTKQQVYDLRFDAEIAIECGVKFTEDNAKALGRGWTEGDLYLAHFLGIKTAKQVLAAPSGANIRDYVTQAAIDANGTVMVNKTTGQVRAWAQWAMDTRWAKLGNPDWIGIWYHKDDNLPIPSAEVIAANSAPLTRKVEGPDLHLVDIDGNGIPDFYERVPRDLPHGSFPEVTHDAPAHEAADEPDVPLRDLSVPIPPGEQGVVGNRDIWLCQIVLKSMHYNPGKVEGKWGGMVAEAIAGFVNDRHMDINVPRSAEEFDEIKAELKHELSVAQDEKFVRPVSIERANATTEKVEEVAPESPKVRRGFFLTLLGSIGSFGAAAYKMVEGWFSEAWSWFTDNEDKVPDDFKSPNKIWEYVQMVPVSAWFVIIGGILAWVAIGNWQVFAKIRQDVQTGMRK